MSVTVVNHGMHYDHPHVQISRHLWSLVGRHEYCNEEMSVLEALAKQLYDFCNGSSRKNLSSGGLFGFMVSYVFSHPIIWCC